MTLRGRLTSREVRALYRQAAFLAAAAIIIAGASTAHCDDGVTFGASLGGHTVLSGDTDPAVVPGLRVAVRGPFAFRSSTPLEFRADLELTAMPGESVNPGDPATFKAVALTAALQREIGRSIRGTQTIRTLAYLEGGAASRLPRDPGPLVRYPRRIALGLEVREETSGAFFRAGGGFDDVAGPARWRQLMLAGEVPVYGLAKKKGKARAHVVIGGDVVLTIGRGNFGPDQRDVSRLRAEVRTGR